MKAKADMWTVVVAGGWNPRVFSPEWVSKNLVNENNVQIEVSLAVPVTLYRLVAGGFLIIPGDDRLVIGIQTPSMAMMSAAEDVAKKAVQRLPHTPLIAVGINFGFIEDAPSDKLTAQFRASDLTELGKSGYIVEQSTLLRKLQLLDGKFNLNLQTTLSQETGQAEIQLNYNQAARSSERALELLSDNAAKLQTLSERLLKDVYDAELEEEA